MPARVEKMSEIQHGQTRSKQARPESAKRKGLGRRIPRGMSDEERRKLLAQPSRRYPTGIRNRALMATMLYAGLRCSEALNLKYGDLDFREYTIRVTRGKGDKDRIIGIDTPLEPLLLEWRARRPAGPRFFSTLDGKPLDPRYVRRMVKRYAVKAGLGTDVHPHRLRHSAATMWINERKISLREVQEMLGHSRISTTERYLHVNPKDLVQKLRASSKR